MGCDLCASVSLVCKVGGVHCSCCVELPRCSLSHCRAFRTAPARWVHKQQWPRGGTLAACVSADGRSPFYHRFEFLQPWHQYNAYYEFKKQFFLQKEGGDSAQVRPRLLWPAHYRHRGACSRLWGAVGLAPDCRPDAHGVLSNFSTSELNETCRSVEISPILIVR